MLEFRRGSLEICRAMETDTPPWKFYGLLYLDDDHTSHANLRNGRDPREIYIRCAHLLARSALASGEDFTLITNDTSAIDRICDYLGISPLRTVSIDFDVAVPQGIPFYQAHQKLSVLKAFASASLGLKVGLIDIDAVINSGFSHLLGEGEIVAYNITSNIPATYLDAFALLEVEHDDCRWYGGEFICGSSDSFHRLWCEIESMLPRYYEQIGNFKHVGDETIVSAAINVLVANGHHVADAGGVIVSRWWSSRTNTPQPTFDVASKASIMHLPADKAILANLASEWDGRGNLAEIIKSKVTMKVRMRQVFNFLSKLTGNDRFAPIFGTSR